MRFIAAAVPFADRWYFDQVLAGAADRAHAHATAVRVVVHAPGPRAHRLVAEDFAQQLEDRDCIGALSVQFDIDAEDAQLLRSDHPVVVIGGRSGGLPSVFIDDAAAARQATEHLLALGHVRIAHLAGYTTAPDDFAMRGDRVRGYSAAMGAAGFEEISQIVPSGFEYGDARRAAVRLLSGADRPTAVFAVSDEVAFAVLDAAAELGLAVPRDVSVIGVDDHEDAERRGLTTIAQHPRALGRAAAARLFGETQNDQQRHEVELVLRASTDVPRGHQPHTRRGVLGRLFGAAPRPRR
ncbi:MAG: LacI family transcriptional regulator [Acidobacteria bacterium]|nr:LacI family transcriptional regulator [Acidobacteriota bacterium]